MRIDGRTMVAGVVGWPAAHSLSPLIHNAWIKALGLDAVYSAYEVEPDGDRFERFVRAKLNAGYVGLNVTAPFKERAFEFADDRGTAREVGNANLLLSKNHGGWDAVWAGNTDGSGLLSALASMLLGEGLNGRRVVVLGAGSAARTAVVTLKKASADVVVVNRTFERASRLATAVGAGAAPWAELDESIRRADILINATSAVHTGQELEVDLSQADVDLTVVEMSYRPLRTPLLRQGEALGLRTVDGLAMLIGQARPSFEMFFGAVAPSAEVLDVRALCLAALDAG